VVVFYIDSAETVITCLVLIQNVLKIYVRLDSCPLRANFDKLILKTIHRHIAKINLLNASQFGFRVRHTMTLQCMRLTDNVSLNFNKNMSTAAVFLDIGEAFDTTWHPALLYKI
jgi:hypothetical protein